MKKSIKILSGVLGSLALISIGAIGATIYHQNQPKAPTKAQELPAAQKPTYRAINSDQGLVKYLDSFLSAEEKARNRQDLEINFSKHAIQVEYIPASAPEPHKIMVAYGGMGVGFDRFITPIYIDYRTNVNPELISAQTKKDLEKIDFHAPLFRNVNLPTSTINKRFGVACGVLADNLLTPAIISDCKKILTRESADCSPFEKEDPTKMGCKSEGSYYEKSLNG